uniref:DUF4780 domain-containing protein n=1 Tax=Caenorhabditis tropicalis TaxID=1561998 RepID=A0A1I7TAC4_9PELO
MFRAYGANGNEPPNKNDRPAMTEDQRTLLAVQTYANKTHDTEKAKRAQRKEDSVHIQAGYGESDSDDDCGGIRIAVSSSQQLSEDQIFKLPETRRIEEVKRQQKLDKERAQQAQNAWRRQTEERNDTYRFRTFPNGVLAHNPYQASSSTSSNKKRKRSRSSSRGRDSRRSSRRSRSRSSSLESRYSSYSRSSSRRDDSRDRRKHKKKKSRRHSSSSESSESSGSSRSAVRIPKNKINEKQQKYEFLKGKEFENPLGDWIMKARKFDSENYVQGCPRKEVASASLGAFYISGLEYDSNLFTILYGTEMITRRKERRTFFEQLAALERRTKSEKDSVESYFRKRAPVDGYWKLLEKPDIINKLNDEEGSSELDLGDELNIARKRVKDCPTDVQSVLKLLDLEEEASRLNIGSFVATDVRALADRHAEILKKSIKESPRSAALQIKRCEVEYLKSEDKKETLAAFLTVCSKFPQEPMTWIKYQNFIQFDSNIYKTELMKSAFDDCLSKARGMLAGTMVSHPITDFPAFRSFYLTTYIRYMKWYLSRGAAPIALACIQATMEFNFGLSNVTEIQERKGALEDFWGRTAPRIGDENATGAQTWFELNWEEGNEERLETPEFAKLINTTKGAISDILERGGETRKNWVEFERYMCDVDARPKRNSFENSKLFESEGEDLTGIHFWETVTYFSESRQGVQVVIPFFASSTETNFDFVQPILELLGIKFIDSSGLYTTTEQVISEWIPNDVFAKYRPNFEKVPTYCEKTCHSTGMRILKFLIKQRHQKCKKDVKIVDDQLMKYIFAQLETIIAKVEKDLNFYKLKKQDFSNLIKDVFKNQLREMVDTYPAAQSLVGFVIADRVATWIKRGVEEQRELENLDKMRSSLNSADCEVLNEHVVTMRDKENSEEMLKFFASYILKFDKAIEGGTISNKYLYDTTISFKNLQLRMYSLIIKSGLYFCNEKTLLDARSMFIKALVDEDEDILEGLTANKSLWDPVDAALKHLMDVVKGREIQEGVHGYPEMPRGVAFCEALQISATFVFLDQNSRPLFSINELTKNIVQKVANYNEQQMNFTRSIGDKARDRIDIQYILDVVLGFFEHEKLKIHYCKNYEELVRAAADTFPCNSKYMKNLAELYSNNRLQWMKLCGILADRNKIVREKQSGQYDEQHERILLQNALAMMYATKRICHKMGGDSRRMLYKHFLNEAIQIHDPAVWRMVFKPAAAVSVRTLTEEAYVHARAQCPWALHILIDYLESRIEDCDIPQWKTVWGQSTLAFVDNSDYHEEHTIFIDDDDVLDTHIQIGAQRDERMDQS